MLSWRHTLRRWVLVAPELLVMVAKETGSFLGTTVAVWRDAPRVQISSLPPLGYPTLAKVLNLPPFPDP